MILSEARKILSESGWLSWQAEDFRAEVLANCSLLRYGAGDAIYGLNDPLGGIYGLVAGAVAVTLAPAEAAPRVFHVGTPGAWIGEGPYLSRQPRRVGMRAAVGTWMMHLPLDAMDQMEKRDPTVVRQFTQILLVNLDILVRAFCDLQKHDGDKRVASVLRRIDLVEGAPIPLSQADLGLMANALRKHVNLALRRFEAQGWVARGYRSIVVTDRNALSRFAEDDDAD